MAVSNESSFNEPSCLVWSPKEVAEWISTLGFPQYKECFISNQVTGRKLVWVTASTLPNLGITDWKHIQTISANIRRLLQVEEPFFNRSITLPHRCEMGIFLEKKSQTGSYSDSLKFEPSDTSVAD